MFLTFIILSGYFTSQLNGQKIHEHMTKEEIQTVFNVNHNSIHKVKYEVVPIFHNNSGSQRKTRQIELRAFNKQYTLSLENTENILLGSNTKVYIPKINNGVVSYEKRSYPAINLQLYHDMDNRAAIALFTDNNNKVHVHGAIGDNIILRPLPSRVRREVLSKYPNTYIKYDPSTGFSSDQTLYHVAMRQNQHFSSVDKATNLQYESQLKSQIDALNRHINQVNFYVDSTPIDYVKRQSIENNINSINLKIKLLNSGHSQADLIIKAVNNLISQTRQLLYGITSNQITNPDGNVPNTGSNHVNVPNEGSNVANLPNTRSGDIVYPEILLVVDYYTYMIHGKDVNNIATYMAAFWNAVDLRYRELSDPKVRLNIAGLVITPQLGVHGFLENHSHSQCAQGVAQDDTKTSAVDYIETLSATSKYFHSFNNEFPKESYDMIVVMTNRRISKMNNGQCSYAVGVAAKVGGACSYTDNKDVAIVTNRGGFDTILTAAHEVGHLLGAPHDKPDEITDPTLHAMALKGGPCAHSLGYLMSYVTDKTTHFHWSPCSKTLIQRFLKSANAQCLLNMPNVGSPYQTILPGKLFSRNEQCQKIMKFNAYAGNNSTYLYSCTTLYCETTTTDDYNRIRHHEINANTQPAEGTSCGNSKICLSGECVYDQSANI